jgi:hypothetical protein
MKTYLAILVVALSLALAGCPKASDPVDNPTSASEKTEGLGQVDQEQK